MPVELVTEGNVPLAKEDEAAVRDFYSLPGHLIRVCKQKSSHFFNMHCREYGITPIQYAVLKLLKLNPSIDQIELAEMAALDTSTTGDVVHRLAQRELVQRRPSGRSQCLTLTSDGQELLRLVEPLVAHSQDQVLAPLTQRERMQLIRLMSKMTGTTNNHHTPSRRSGTRNWRSNS